MKPYLLVLYNGIRFSLCSFFHSKWKIAKLQLLSTSTKIQTDTESALNLGSKLISDGRVSLNVSNGGLLEIGDRVYFNDGVMISCKEKISIGQGCLFGPCVKVFDNNHKFDAQNGVSFQHTTAPITIGNNCWLASNVIILKGTTIGNNCVIGAGCVVSGNIPDSSIVTQKKELEITPMRNSKGQK